MVDRILLIIDQLSRHGDGQTLADLAKATGLPKSTLHRILNLLVDKGAVARGGTTYRLGTLLSNLGRPRHGLTPDIRRRLMPHLMELHRRTGLATGLAVLDLPEVVFLELLYGHEHSPFIRHVPDRAPAHCTAAGKILLATRPEGLGSYQPSNGSDPRGVINLAEIQRQLAASRSTGIAMSCGELLPGTHAIAAPIIGPDGKPIAAVAVCALAAHSKVSDAVSHLRRTAHYASLALRHGPVAATRDAPVPRIDEAHADSLHPAGARGRRLGDSASTAYPKGGRKPYADARGDAGQVDRAA